MNCRTIWVRLYWFCPGIQDATAKTNQARKFRAACANGAFASLLATPKRVTITHILPCGQKAAWLMQIK